MQTPESYRLFLRRLYRGRIIMVALFLVLAIAGGLTFLLPGYRGWAAFFWLSDSLCLMGRWHVGARYMAAVQVCSNPQIVYWVHSGTPMLPMLRGWLGTLMLHLRDGTQLEIEVPPKNLEEVIAWLKEKNPSLRCGPYE